MCNKFLFNYFYYLLNVYVIKYLDVGPQILDIPVVNIYTAPYLTTIMYSQWQQRPLEVVFILTTCLSSFFVYFEFTQTLIPDNAISTKKLIVPDDVTVNCQHGRPYCGPSLVYISKVSFKYCTNKQRINLIFCFRH